MNKTISSFFLVFTFLFFFGCAGAGFKDSYVQYYDDDFFPEDAFSIEESDPAVIYCDDLEVKFREISSDWNLCIGGSRFNGGDISASSITSALKKLCIEKNAVIALYSRHYTNTRTGTYSVPHTDYHYFMNPDGYPSSFSSISYTTVPYAEDRYQYQAYYFIKISEKYRKYYAPGFLCRELEQNDRDMYKQNTGCLIDIVYKNTPAFYANFVHGDIIIKINGRAVNSAQDFYHIQGKSGFGSQWTVTVVRDSKPVIIKVKYGI